jgi:membrane protein DedA with SNARE-associated domain/rhodanese-related sulfurtransferase
LQVHWRSAIMRIAARGPAMHIDDLLRIFQAHGEAGIFLIVLTKRMGVPIPVVPFLLLAGARSMTDASFAFAVLGLATLASVLADAIWYAAGRRYGRNMLELVCRISMSPDTCIRKSELAFAGRGALTVLAGKFLPGVGGLVPPLAGALGMPVASFTLLNLAGSLAWTATVLVLGLLFHEQLTMLMAMLQGLGGQAVPLLLLALAAWLGWLALRRVLVTIAALKAPRIAPRELAERIARGEPLLVLDVRGSAVAEQSRIPGAVHASSEHRLLDAAQRAPEGMDVIAYCDCPNDVSAARIAAKLRKRGLPVRVLAGGYRGWIAEGLPLHEAEAADAMPLAAMDAAR